MRMTNEKHHRISGEGGRKRVPGYRSTDNEAKLLSDTFNCGDILYTVYVYVPRVGRRRQMKGGRGGGEVQPRAGSLIHATPINDRPAIAGERYYYIGVLKLCSIDPRASRLAPRPGLSLEPIRRFVFFILRYKYERRFPCIAAHGIHAEYRSHLMRYHGPRVYRVAV